MRGQREAVGSRTEDGHVALIAHLSVSSLRERSATVNVPWDRPGGFSLLRLTRVDAPAGHESGLGAPVIALVTPRQRARGET